MGTWIEQTVSLQIWASMRLCDLASRRVERSQLHFVCHLGHFNYFVKRQ